MGNLLFWFFQRVQKYRWAAVTTLAAVVVASLYVASGLKMEEDIFDVMPGDESLGEVAQILNELKINNRLVVHVYHRDTVNGTPDSLIHLAHHLADSLGKYSENEISGIELTVPDSRLEALHDFYYQNLPLYLDEADYREIDGRTSEEALNNAIDQFYRSLISPVGAVTKKFQVKDPLGLTFIPLERARNFQLDKNFSLYRNHILTTDRNHLVFFIDLAFAASETGRNSKLVEELEKHIADFEQSHPDMAVEYFGSAAVAVANAGRIRADINLTVGLALVFLLIFISFFYRSFKTFFLVLLPGIFGALIALAMLAVVRDSVSLISLAVGSVLLGITIDYALHFLTHAKSQKDTRRLFSDLAAPTLLCGVTTACAFFALLFISSPALQDLGIFAGISVLAAALFTLLALPHFVIKRHEEEPGKVSKNLVERAVDKMAGYPLHRKKWALGLFGMLTLASLLFWRGIGFETDMLKLNFMPEKLARYEGNINRISSFSANSIFVAHTGEDIWEALAKGIPVGDKLGELKDSGKILNYLSVQSLVPSPALQKSKTQRWNAYWSEQKQGIVIDRIRRKADSLGFQAGVFSAFEKLLGESSFEVKEKEVAELLKIFGDNMLINHEDGSVTVITSVKLEGGYKREVLDELAAIPGTVILDKGYITSRLVDLLADDFTKLVNISLTVVFLILLLSYGRMELTLLAFTPILLSWLWVLGLMGMLGLTFNIVNVIICTFIFGLGIDYSIFGLRGHLQGYTYAFAAPGAYKKSIILSAITTLFGIGVLIFAQHPALKSIAFLAIIGVVSVVFITFTVQPLMFAFLMGRRKKKGKIPYTIGSLITTSFAFLYFLLGCVLLGAIRLVLMLPLGKLKSRKLFFHRVLMLFCRSLVYAMANTKKTVIDKPLADFEKPAVIIANHHSFIDILIVLMFHPKVVLVTNDWVYNSPFFGRSVRFADFIPTPKGLDNQTEKMRELIKDGYSIAVFPEGSRSHDAELRRFHKGAFYLAEKFGLDIQPLIIHGTSHVMPKGDDFYLKNNPLTIKFLPRIAHANEGFGSGYKERGKLIGKHFKAAHAEVRTGIETPAFFKEIVVKNFIYKGPVLEWYLRIKLRFEKNYALFHDLIPGKGKVVDLGCGYGFMSYALAMSSSERKITALDYDRSKIEVARGCPVHPDNISFAHGDVVNFEFGDADVFILSDVLHYLRKDEQQCLLERMLKHLNIGGRIILRDGDSAKAKRHKGSVLTEFFSTNLGFNKTRNSLNFISTDFIRKFADEQALSLEIIDNTRRTSNLVFVLERKE